MTDIENRKSRIILVYFCILVAFAVIILRMFFVVAFGDRIKVSKTYDAQKLTRRSNIIDRNHTLVATDLKTKSLYLSSILIKNPQTVAAAVSGIFSDISYQEILKKIVDGKSSKNRILLKRNLTPSQVNQVQNLKIAGLIFENDRIRVYPQKSITSHLVGYVDLDRKGLSGIEMQYDKQIARGSEDIELALDIRVQDILHDELLNGIEQYKAKAAAGVIMDVTNGEVLAVSSLPDFDPNLQHEATADQRFNRVINGVYELGSIFKIFTNTIAFEENLAKMSDVYNVREPIKYGRFTINDDHAYKDEMTVAEIFSYSSNIGTIQLAKKIGIDLEKDYLEKFGLLKKIDTEFPGLGRPISPKIWREINLYTISYGHGIAITPLHIAATVSAIVNGGILYKPSFLKLKDQPKGRRIIKESTSDTMRQMMRKVVLEGTGRNANVEGYEVAGKTGTANRAESGGYNEKSTMASFVAVFPISKPKYLVYVIFDRPNYIFNTGGMVAAPVAGRIVKNIAPILDVIPQATSAAASR
ncbi:MAG: penicillin-binding protein 2 [Proteobacteria bacterium]|nr:penicillin-binding protein 2 [Pseudomonadota bacterium]